MFVERGSYEETMVREGVKLAVRLCKPPLVDNQANDEYLNAHPHLILSADYRLRVLHCHSS